MEIWYKQVTLISLIIQFLWCVKIPFQNPFFEINFLLNYTTRLQTWLTIYQKMLVKPLNAYIFTPSQIGNVCSTTCRIKEGARIPSQWPRTCLQQNQWSSISTGVHQSDYCILRYFFTTSFVCWVTIQMPTRLHWPRYSIRKSSINISSFFIRSKHVFVPIVN